MPKGRALGHWKKKVKGVRRTDWWLQTSPGDVRYSMGNAVSNTAITTHGARRALEIPGGTP